MTERLFFTASAGFEAARRITRLQPNHRASSLHGHSFVAQVRAALPAAWGGYRGAELAALRAHLAQAVEPLDYAYLNTLLEQPADEQLACWLRERLDLPGVYSVGIRSTCDAGADLASDGQAHIWRKYAFESAHRLPNVGPGHKCGRMHGHGFKVVLHVAGAAGARENPIDYDLLDAVWAPLHKELDFSCLNDLPGLGNPTSELLSSWIWQRLKPQLAALSRVTVYETASCGAHFDGMHYRIWKDMPLDSAVRLKYAPEGDPRRRIHGHTYVLRLHLHAPLDAVMGWTVDFGDVKELFTPIFKQLDHHPLYEIADVDDNDTASLARYIRQQGQTLLPQLDRIDLFEAPGCGAMLSIGQDNSAILF